MIKGGKKGLPSVIKMSIAAAPCLRPELVSVNNCPAKLRAAGISSPPLGNLRSECVIEFWCNINYCHHRNTFYDC